MYTEAEKGRIKACLVEQAETTTTDDGINNINIIPCLNLYYNNQEPKNENDLFNNTRVIIADTEVLTDYFSFQFKRLDKESANIKHNNIKLVDNVYIFECFNDNDCIEFVNFYTTSIMKENTFLYVYNKPYDKSILSILVNLVNNKEKDILTKLRNASDYIINNQIDYDIVCRTHWSVIFDNNTHDSNKEKEILANLKHESVISFYKKFNRCLANKAEKKKVNGKNTKVIKIVDIPRSNEKILCSGTKNGKPLPIGLKTLQLIELDKQFKFDFNKYSSIEEIKKDNKYDTWLNYGSYDVITAEYIFNKHVRSSIVNRFYAIKAVNEKKLFAFNYNAMFNETNTELINYLFGIDSKIEIDFKYTDYINTEIEKFNDFVEFLDNNKNITSSELKVKYNKPTTLNINGCECDIGLGGIHGVKKQYINKDNNIYDCDYASLYPNIIINHKNLFKNIMDVELYENVKNLRFKYKKLKKETDDIELKTEYDKIQSGLKLLLNSTYGIINSTYGGIAYKPLGLFICLYGQATAIKMLLHDKDCKPVNVNTDGVYFEIPESKDIEKYISELSNITNIDLEAEKFQTLIQKDVNNYIAVDSNGKIRRKGSYNISFKNKINKCSRPISVNTENAIKLIEKKRITIEPIYFKDIIDLNNEKYYFTSKLKGKPLIKDLTKPVNYLINGKPVYVTNDIKKAELSLYREYARIELDKIYSFDTAIETSKHYEREIVEDKELNNKLKRSNIKRLRELFDCDMTHIGYCGFNGNVKATTYSNGKPIKQLINYTKTELLKSTETMGLKIQAKDNLVIVDIDIINKETGKPKDNIDWNFINKLKEIDTYKTWNSKTEEHNFKIVFKNDKNVIFKPNKKHIKYIEVLKEAVVWTIDNPVRTYKDNNKEVLNISKFEHIFNNYFEVKENNATEYIEKVEQYEYVKNNIDMSQEIKILCKLLDDYNIKIFKVHDKSIETSCPYCNYYNKDHYKRHENETDAYININQSKSAIGYELNIQNMSNTCKEDIAHKEFYNKLNAEFINLLPTPQERKKEELIKDIKECINKEELEKLDEKLLLENTLRIVGTGGHKTFQSARKLIENVFVNEIFHIHSTKENKHISDFEREVKKILCMVIKDRTHLIDEFLENDTKGLHDIGIHKLTITSSIDENKLENLKGIVTNHTYWYRNGHSSTPNKNMEKVINHIKDKPHEIVIDEYESFKKKGVISIQLNGYTYYNEDKDGLKTYKNAPSCLYPATERTVKKLKISPFSFAEEHRNIEMFDTRGIWKYKSTFDGKKDLDKQIQQYTTIDNKSLIDCGRRKPKCIEKNKYEYGYITVDKVTQYKIKEIPEDMLEKYDFLKLISRAKAIAIVRKIIKVGSIANNEMFNVNNWGKEIETIEELKEYGKELSNAKIKFDSFKKQLKKEVGNELFIDNLHIYTTPTLDNLNGTKYYLTANIPKNTDIHINDELAGKSSDYLKDIEVCIINSERNADNKIINNLHLLKDKPFKTLAFTALSSKVNDLIHSEIDTSFMRIKATLPDDEGGKTKTVSYNTEDKEDIDDNITVTTTLAYVNGTESQGRSYSNTELLILNATAQVNIKGRIDVNRNNEIVVNSIEEETQDRLKQAIGRIFRGEYKYKAIIIFGDVTVIREMFNSYPDDFSIKFNIEKYNKQHDSTEKLQEAMEDIINYYEYKMGHCEEREHFNTDKRNTNKYTKIKKLYLAAQEKYLKENPKKKKLSSREAEKILNIPMKTIQRALKEA